LEFVKKTLGNGNLGKDAIIGKKIRKDNGKVTGWRSVCIMEDNKHVMNIKLLVKIKGKVVVKEISRRKIPITTTNKSCILIPVII